MSKKLLSLIVLLSMSTLLTGCADVIDLTDTETRLIAEYAGGLLLKYDLGYNDRIVEGEKIEKEMEEEALENPEPATTTEIIEPDTEATTEEVVQNKGNEINSNIDDSEVTVESDADNSQSVGTESDIAKILGMDGLSITFNDYLITDRYPDSDEGEQFLYLDASKGYKLLVLRFNIVNNSSNTVKFTMLDEEVDYRIVCNGKNAANPMLTILLNDLCTMESVISPDENQEGVLVFQISDSMKDNLSSIELKVLHNDVENVITIL